MLFGNLLSFSVNFLFNLSEVGYFISLKSQIIFNDKAKHRESDGRKNYFSTDHQNDQKGIIIFEDFPARVDHEV